MKIRICRVSHLRIEAEIFFRRLIISKNVLDKNWIITRGTLIDAAVTDKFDTLLALFRIILINIYLELIVFLYK